MTQYPQNARWRCTKNFKHTFPQTPLLPQTICLYLLIRRLIQASLLLPPSFSPSFVSLSLRVCVLFSVYGCCSCMCMRFVSSLSEGWAYLDACVCFPFQLFSMQRSGFCFSYRKQARRRIHIVLFVEDLLFTLDNFYEGSLNGVNRLEKRVRETWISFEGLLDLIEAGFDQLHLESTLHL